MDEKHDVAGKSRGPLWSLTVAWLVTLVVLVALGWSAWASHRRLASFTSRALRIQELQGRIAHLDEVLTMSARMAAATGDLGWEERYLEFVSALEADIAEARTLVPDLKGTEETDAANQRLVQLETRAFELVHEQRDDEALAILLGEGYTAQKAAYAKGMVDLDARLEATVEAERRSQERRAVALVLAAAVVIPVLVVGWLVVLRMLQRWRRELEQELTRRERLERAIAASTHEVTSAAAQIAASAQQQEQTVRTFRDATTRAASAVHEIAATLGNLKRTMDEVNDVARHTTERATMGQERLGELHDAMHGLGEATGALGSKIDVIKEAAGRINPATSTMVKVVAQTELLSVNSAIEAEKAAAHAGGFHVVSSEIRRLAEETAKSTLEIESIVEGIHASVAGGIREVGRFEQQVQQSFGRVQQIADELGAVIADVAGLGSQFAGISEAMTEQATGTDQIRTAIQQLDGGAEEIVALSSEFARVTRRLDGVGRSLQEQVSSFASGGHDTA
jgi:chromosome segregation ATPase